MPEFDMHRMFVSLAVLAVATSIGADTWWTPVEILVHQVSAQMDVATARTARLTTM